MSHSPVRVVAAGSEHPVPAHAVAECLGVLLDAEMVGADLVWLVATPAFGGALADMGSAAVGTLAPGVLVGTVAGTIVAGGRALDRGAGLGVLAVGGVRCHPLRVEPGTRVGAAMVGLPAGSTVAVVADEHSVDVPDLLPGRGGDVDPGLPTVVGGFPDLRHDRGAGRFLLDSVEHLDGAVGVALAPDVEVGVAAADAWSAVGRPLEVQEVEGSAGPDAEGVAEITFLSGRPASEILLELLASHPPGAAVQLGLRDLDSGEVMALGSAAPSPGIRVSPAPRPGALVELVAVTVPSARSALLGMLVNGSPHGGSPGAVLGFLDHRRPRLLDPGPEGDAFAIGGMVRGGAVLAMGCSRVLAADVTPGVAAAAAAVTFG